MSSTLLSSSVPSTAGGTSFQSKSLRLQESLDLSRYMAHVTAILEERYRPPLFGLI